MPTVLITGASSGIGKASALRLLDEGFRVYGAARRVDRMQDLEERGGTALPLDVTKDDSMQAALSRVLVESESIDILVNNAGYGLYGPVEEVPMDEARHQFEVNLFGLARLTQLVLPHMREQGGGRIVNMSSMGGKIYTPMGAWYHATKHALEGWSDCLRLEVARFGIHVVVIEPGVIQTEFGEVVAASSVETSEDSAYAELARAVAEGAKRTYRPGGGSPPEVIADLVARAAKDERPRTRYVAGKYARLLIELRRWCGDRVFDWAVMRRF
jgi:NAD(P)-dependent dehydrogenase (short-subunit alcohol dehydrogenase family)